MSTIQPTHHANWLYKEPTIAVVPKDMDAIIQKVHSFDRAILQKMTDTTETWLIDGCISTTFLKRSVRCRAIQYWDKRLTAFEDAKTTQLLKTYLVAFVFMGLTQGIRWLECDLVKKFPALARIPEALAIGISCHRIFSVCLSEDPVYKEIALANAQIKAWREDPLEEILYLRELAYREGIFLLTEEQKRYVPELVEWSRALDTNKLFSDRM